MDFANYNQKITFLAKKHTNLIQGILKKSLTLTSPINKGFKGRPSAPIQVYHSLMIQGLVTKSLMRDYIKNEG